MRIIAEAIALGWALCEARALARFALNFAVSFWRGMDEAMRLEMRSLLGRSSW